LDVLRSPTKDVRLHVLLRCMTEKKKARKPIVLTSHPSVHSASVQFPIVWGALDPKTRGPIIGTLTHLEQKNCMGTHSGSYSVYRALAVASGALDPLHVPDLTNTAPTSKIGPFESWCDARQIVSIDPWGADVGEVFAESISQGVNVQPTIAVTRAHITMPEIVDDLQSGKIPIDGEIVRAAGDVCVTKAAIEPVWYLPGVAERFGISESELRRGLFEQTGGMFPELVTRPDLHVLLPPIGGQTVYFFGDVASIPDLSKELTIRIHDECNGSDVFGSDICTCRPYLVHGIQECIKTAQKGGCGVIVYNRKEGRALGEVTKFLVYNARKRQDGGDRADKYFHRTECVAGVQDMRFQELMPDVLHWMGVKRIDRLVSMSDMKYNAITRSGIEVVERVSIPDDKIPSDARVEMDAKKAAGYYSADGAPSAEQLKNTKGRGLEE
jgi:GTP cyclohydrolase II